MNDASSRQEPTREPAAAAIAEVAAEPAAGSATEVVAEPSRRVRVRPLMALVPFVMRYRVQVIAALVALLVASVATLGRAGRGAPA